jgi:hypothetical protein
MTAELNGLNVFWTLHLPRITVLEPAVRLLDLIAADDLLAENAVVVPETVAETGEIESRHRIEIARGETAEAAIAETSVGFVIAEIVPVDAVLLESLASKLIGLEVDDVIAEKSTHQKLERHVINALRVLLAVIILRVDPALDDAVSHRVGERRVLVARSGAVDILR